MFPLPSVGLVTRRLAATHDVWDSFLVQECPRLGAVRALRILEEVHARRFLLQLGVSVGVGRRRRAELSPLRLSHGVHGEEGRVGGGRGGVTPAVTALERIPETMEKPQKTSKNLIFPCIFLVFTRFS